MTLSSPAETTTEAPLILAAVIAPTLPLWAFGINMLVADALRDCTARGDIVLDTFLGSGTTLMAAEETGRAFRGCDLDPPYVDVAIRRWQAKTHVDAGAKGELLRPDVYDEKTIRRLRKSTNFRALFQQDVAGAKRLRIKAKHFGLFSIDEIPDRPIVLSVDPGFERGDENSFSVIQAWVEYRGRHYLVDVWRAQAEYEDVGKAVRTFRRKYQPAKISIEAAGYGLALYQDRRIRKYAKKIKLSNRSKEERLAVHTKAIRAGSILVREDGGFRDEFIDEVVDFSTGKARYDDQVDAMTQYLDYMATDPHLEIHAAVVLSTCAKTAAQFRSFSRAHREPSVRSLAAARWVISTAPQPRSSIPVPTQRPSSMSWSK
jgi:predicted phage terminase large subunit-like protein